MRRRRPGFQSGQFTGLIERAGRQITDSLKDSSLIKDHHASSGGVRESGFKEFLRQLLPERYYVGTGFAFDARDSQSRQLDIVIALEPPLVRVLEKDGMCYLPCEVVLAVIEVKKTMTAEEVRRTVRNAASVRSLRPFGTQEFAPARRGGARLESHQHRCFYSVVAFDSDLSLDGWAQREWDRTRRASEEYDVEPDVIDRAVILDRGIINTHEGLALNGAGAMEPVILNWFVHLSNHLDREAGRRPSIDIDIYTLNPRWTRLT